MALFESYERRIPQINAVLNKYGISSIEEAEKICFDWRQTLNGLLREQDQIKAEMSEARQDQARKGWLRQS